MASTGRHGDRNGRGRAAVRGVVGQAFALNRVLAQAAQTAPDRDADAVAVLDHYRRETGCAAACGPGEQLRALAAALARIHLEGAEGAPIAHAHCHLADGGDAGPLWLRARLVEAMKRLAGRPVAVLLVTGVRTALCPEGRRWTRRRAGECARLVEWIDELAADWCSPSTRLQVIVL